MRLPFRSSRTKITTEHREKRERLTIHLTGEPAHFLSHAATDVRVPLVSATVEGSADEIRRLSEALDEENAE